MKICCDNKIVACIVVLALIVLYGCEKKIELDVPLKDVRLIVDGLITDQDTAYYVKLSRTSKYNFTFDSAKVEWESGARVIIADNAGNKDTLDEIASGIYRSDPLRIKGLAGRFYNIDIVTKAGAHFQSEPEGMIQVPPIEAIYFDRNSDDRPAFTSRAYRYTVYLDWHDPAAVANYYLHDISYYWGNSWHDEIGYSSIFTDKFFNGQHMKGWEATSGYGESLFYIRINRYSLSKKAYLFWNLANDQTENSDDGSSNTSVPLIGNVYNADNPDEYALGYFLVSAKSSAAVYINR